MSWEDQGRDEDGRFGHGTAPPKIIGPRIDAIAYSAVANLPRGDRHRESASFDQQGRQRLRTAMTAWAGARGMSDAAFEDRFLESSVSSAVVEKLRAAAEGVRTAATQKNPAAASADLAAAMQGVGLNKWPAFLRQAADKADAVVSASSSTARKGAGHYNAPSGRHNNPPADGGQNAGMTMSADGRAELARREGHRLGYYNDSANNCTYGTGILAHRGPCTAEELHRTVDAAQADAEFQRQVELAAQRVRDLVRDRHLTQSQFDALVSATFSTGRDDNRRFLNDANQGDDAAVIRDLRAIVNTRDHNAHGQPVGPLRRDPGLVRRREDEIRQYRGQ